MEESEKPTEPGEEEEFEGTLSPTLTELDESRHPKDKTVCETCPNAVWFVQPKEVKCYCRVMFLIVWSNKEPNQFLACDGEYLGDE